MDKNSLGSMIKKVRKSRGYTQQVLAEKSDIGLMYYGEIERGTKMPSINTFIKIIEALEVSADYILQNELSSGKEYVFDELTHKLQKLTPKQRKTASEILDAYIRNL